MSFEDEKEQVKEEPADKCVLSIHMTKDGGMFLKGSIVNDIMLVYAVLERAKDVARKESEPKIVKGGIMQFVRGNGHR